ncbi:verprolin-like isoform X2 [Mugil cephalus]|uniref:verprolin-like isoform X2 n=1 Tax=Mugil cephalus TaxID=48193 RepID=UPI001FB675BC|nr:verprolin-like isoform X2 [Mugil cephalus]
MMDEQVNPLERDHLLSVVLPGGVEKKATVPGSKAVMDLLVTLCASYHLNPSDYTVEVLSPNKNNISFKPNSPIGSLEADKIVLKPKGMEEKIRQPYMPEATVRLLINYNKSHKAVVRVNPRLPLEMLLPAVCDKCEFKVETTVLLRDSQSEEPLDLTKTLNDHGLREVFAKDTAGKHLSEGAITPTEVISPPPLQDNKQKQKENTGFLSLFRRRKKKHEAARAASVPASPGLGKQTTDGRNSEAAPSSNTLTADMPKKRRAPQPPMGALQSVPSNLSTCHLRGAQRSADSTLRSTKRRAPPPPCANTLQKLQSDTDVKGTLDSLNTPEEPREKDESDSVKISPSSSSPPRPSRPHFSHFSHSSLAHLHEVADPYLPSFRGKDLSDARSALAKVLTSSVSKGTLVKRLRSSATFHKFHHGSSAMATTPTGSDDGGFCEELDCVLKAESGWEDPVERRRLTTFKVVPPKKPDPEPKLDVPDQSLTLKEDEAEVESVEDELSSDTSKIETPSPSPAQLPAPPLQHLDDCTGPVKAPHEVEDTVTEENEAEEPEVMPSDCSDGEFSETQISQEDQSPSTDMDHCSPCSGDTNTEEEVAQDEEAEEEEVDVSFPPPPPPVFFNDEVMEDQRGDPAPPSPSSPPPTPPTPSGAARQDVPSAKPDQPPDEPKAAPSRFAEAVAMAVQRSRQKGLGPPVSIGPHTTLPSPGPLTTYQYGA